MVGSHHPVPLIGIHAAGSCPSGATRTRRAALAAAGSMAHGTTAARKAPAPRPH